jgi:hypothetical protein
MSNINLQEYLLKLQEVYPIKDYLEKRYTVNWLLAANSKYDLLRGLEDKIIAELEELLVKHFDIKEHFLGVTAWFGEIIEAGNLETDKTRQHQLRIIILFSEDDITKNKMAMEVRVYLLENSTKIEVTCNKKTKRIRGVAGIIEQYLKSLIN